MKLALSIGGTQISLPPEIQKLNDKASGSNYGGNIIGAIINVLLFGAVIVALFFIIYGGIKWIISEGDAKNIEVARNTIINAAIGLFIAFFALLIVNVIGKFFGISLLGQ